MKTHHSPLAAAITLTFALSVVAMSAGAAGPAGTTTPAATPPTATPGASQMPPIGPGQGAGMNPGQGSMMGPYGGPGRWGGQGPMGSGWRGMNPQMMQERYGTMQQHAQAVETHLANIEALLREFVQLQNGQKAQ